MALLGLEGALKHYYYYYYLVTPMSSHVHVSCYVHARTSSMYTNTTLLD
jgi:hypothetical protein